MNHRLTHLLDGRHGLLMAVECGKVRAEAARKTAERKKARYRDDPVYRAMLNCRNRLRFALKSAKSDKTVRRMIGCTTTEFRAHIESLFWPGMTWENYGQWEIDHQKPCSWFDLRIPSQQAECFHYLNLRPLWRAHNRSDGDRKSKRLDWSKVSAH